MASQANQPDCAYCSKQRYVVSIDLENGLVSEYGHQTSYFTTATKTGLNYEGWVIDESLEIAYSQAFALNNFVIEYDTYTSDLDLLHFMVSPAPSKSLYLIFF